MKHTSIGAALLLFSMVTDPAAVVGLPSGEAPAAAWSKGASASHSSMMVAISGMTYEGEYTASQAVRIFRLHPAMVVVKGANLHLASTAQIVTSSGAPAPGMSATVLSRRTGEISILINSSAAAEFAEYSVRIRFPIETNGPDVFRVQLFQRGTISALSIEGGDASRLMVGNSYTLLVTGSNLERIDCCGLGGLDDAVVRVTQTSRSSTSARFTVVMKQGYGKRIGASHFFDDNLPSPPTFCGTACYAGSASIVLDGVVSPRVTALSPNVQAAYSSVTIMGSDLAPRGHTVSLMYREKYSLSSKTVPISNPTDGSISFTAPRNILGDSLVLMYLPTGAADAERLAGSNVVLLPPLFVKEAPTVAGTGSVVTMLTTSGERFWMLKPGTGTILGMHLLSPPPSVSRTITSGVTSGGTRDGSALGGATTLGSMTLPAVSFVRVGTSTPWTVRSAAYDVHGSQPSIDGGSGSRGVDRVVVDVPDFGANTYGNIVVTTTTGSDALDFVVVVTTPKISRVDQASNPTSSGSSTRTLVRGQSYVVHGTALQVMHPHGTSGAATTLRLNGATIPGATPSMVGMRLEFRVPSTASSGALTIETLGGIGNAGTFTVIDPPTAPAISGFVLAPSPVTGGTTTTATVSFAGPIPPDGSAGQLLLQSRSEQAIASLAPVAITGNPMVVPLPTKLVGTTRTVNVDASLSGASTTAGSRSASVTVEAPRPTGILLGSQSVVGGRPVNGTVQLNTAVPASAGIPVTLTSSDPTTGTVPATATMNGSTATFTVSTALIPVQRTVTITATIGGESRSATLTVDAAGIGTLTTAANQVVSGRGTTGTITLTGALVGASAQLTVNNPLVTVPASVALSGTSTTFPIATFGVAVPTAVVVTATVNGVARSDTLTLEPITLQSIAIVPGKLAAGSTATITVRLSAPSVGVISVTFSVSDPSSLNLPSSVSFAEGQDVAIVALTAKSPISAERMVTVGATLTRNLQSAGSLSAASATSSTSRTVVVTP